MLNNYKTVTISIQLPYYEHRPSNLDKIAQFIASLKSYRTFNTL